MDQLATACINGVWPPFCGLWMWLRRTDRWPCYPSFSNPSTSIPMEHMAWRFWMTKQSNGCSAPAPRSSAAQQWIEKTRSNDEELATGCIVGLVVDNLSECMTRKCVLFYLSNTLSLCVLLPVCKTPSCEEVYRSIQLVKVELRGSIYVRVHGLRRTRHGIYEVSWKATATCRQSCTKAGKSCRCYVWARQYVCTCTHKNRKVISERWLQANWSMLCRCNAWCHRWSAVKRMPIAYGKAYQIISPNLYVLPISSRYLMPWLETI